MTSNFALIERTIAFACRRYRLLDNDAEEFASVVKLRLVENDYAILRAYENRSSFATFISIVVQRMALDYRIHEWGKWHDSAEAKRLGPVAVELDRLLHRDGRTLEEAFVALSPRNEGVTPESLAAIAARLPERAPRRRDVDLEHAELAAVTPSEVVEERLLARERLTASEQLSALMSDVIHDMPEQERLILHLRFEGGMAISQIARMLQLDQKLLYRRLETLMRELRKRLEHSGIAARDVLDLVGRDDAPIHFDLGNRLSRPSIVNDETVAAHRKGSQ